MNKNFTAVSSRYKMARRVAIFGDSIPRDLGNSQISDLRIEEEVRYFCIGGLSLQRCYKHRHPVYLDLLQYQPTDVFLHLGGNDFRAWVPVRDVIELMAAVVDELYPARVFIGDILPRGRTMEFTGLTTRQFCEMAATFNEKVREVFPGTVLPFYIHETRKPDGSLSKFFRKDEIYLSRRDGITKYRKTIRHCLM